jgi:hypothetical protein
VTVLGKRQLCVVKCKRKDLLSTSIVGKNRFISAVRVKSWDEFSSGVSKITNLNFLDVS